MNIIVCIFTLRRMQFISNFLVTGFKELGNEGWDWSEFVKYFRKVCGICNHSNIAQIDISGRRRA